MASCVPRQDRRSELPAKGDIGISGQEPGPIHNTDRRRDRQGVQPTPGRDHYRPGYPVSPSDPSAPGWCNESYESTRPDRRFPNAFCEGMHWARCVHRSKRGMPGRDPAGGWRYSLTSNTFSTVPFHSTAGSPSWALTASVTAKYLVTSGFSSSYHGAGLKICR